MKAQGSTTSTGSDGGATYNFAVFGLSLGAAGVILAIIAMVRRNKNGKDFPKFRN